MASDPKKRRVEAPGRISPSTPTEGDGDKPASSSTSLLPAAATPATAARDRGVNLQAAKQAVEEARQDHWLANFKAFESPFGNYIVPVVPIRADFLSQERPF